MKAKQKGGRLLIVAAALLWGLAGVCVKSITWGTMALVLARSLLTLPILFLFKKTKGIHPNRTNLLGAAAMTATGMLYIQAIKLTTAGTAIVLQYIAPILVFLYCVLFQKRKATLAEILITLAVFSGIVLCFSDSLDMTQVLGNVLAILSGFTFAAQILVMNGEGSDSSDCLILSCLMSIVIALPFVIFGEPLSFDRDNLIWVCVLGIFQYGLANALFGVGIKRTDAVESSLILTLEPVFNPIPVALFCGEMMGTRALIGAGIVVLALAAQALVKKNPSTDDDHSVKA